MWTVQYFNYMQLQTRLNLQVGTYGILKKKMTNKIVLGSQVAHYPSTIKAKVTKFKEMQKCRKTGQKLSYTQNIVNKVYFLQLCLDCKYKRQTHK